MAIDVIKKLYLDYEIQEVEHILRKSFIEVAIAEASQDVETLRELGSEISSLKNRLKILKTLLHETLYPGNYDEWVATLSIK